jgi:hypothetical protein
MESLGWENGIGRSNMPHFKRIKLLNPSPSPDEWAGLQANKASPPRQQSSFAKSSDGRDGDDGDLCPNNPLWNSSVKIYGQPSSSSPSTAPAQPKGNGGKDLLDDIDADAEMNYFRRLAGMQ